jgi:hypothetical protein
VAWELTSNPKAWLDLDLDLDLGLDLGLDRTRHRQDHSVDADADVAGAADVAEMEATVAGGVEEGTGARVGQGA